VDAAALAGASRAEKLAGARTLFQYHCASCHAAENGFSALGHLLRGWTPDMIHKVVEAPEKAHFFMPPWAGTADEATVLTEYLVSIAPPPPAACISEGGDAMNPSELSHTEPARAPAPYALLVGLKSAGFTLHMAAMNLWYAGIAVALWQRTRSARSALGRPAHGADAAPRGARINFGIVPLLFLQVSDYRAFYPATILMAWPWLSIIGALVVAYYGVYAYAVGLKSGRMASWRRGAGILSALLFLYIGSSSERYEPDDACRRLAALWRGANDAGAVLGTALNTSDPTLWPRWLLMIGLAITTVAAHAVVDAGIFDRGGGEEQRRWRRASRRDGTPRHRGFAAAGSWYVFGTWGADLRTYMLAGPRCRSRQSRHSGRA